MTTELRLFDSPLTPEGEPKCVRPWYYGHLIGLFIDAATVSALYLLAWWLGVGPTATPLIWLLFVAGCVASEVAHWRFYERYRELLQRRVLKSDFRVCLRCGYSLLGLPDTHQCPECGQPFAREELRSAWEPWLKKHFGYERKYHEMDREVLETLRRRKTCIRCGHDIREVPTRICPACGARHGYEEPQG